MDGRTLGQAIMANRQSDLLSTSQSFVAYGDPAFRLMDDLDEQAPSSILPIAKEQLPDEESERPTIKKKPPETKTAVASKKPRKKKVTVTSKKAPKKKAASKVKAREKKKKKRRPLRQLLTGTKKSAKKK